MKRRALLGAAAAPWLIPGAAPAAPSFPDRPLTIVLSTPAGGASDTAARQLAQALARILGQRVVVENRPGGLGVPAVQAVRAAPADGHTLLWANASMAALPLLVQDAPIRSMAEFTPVAPVVQLVYGLFVNPRVPATTLAEFSAHLRAHPGRLSYGTGVPGEFMAAAHYLRAVGATALQVPYKGGVQLMPDLIRGELQFNIGPLAPALPHVRSGKLRLLATLPERSDAAPGVPAFHEAGLAMDAVPTWNGLVAPPGTPREVSERLAAAVHQALADAGLRRGLEAQGLRVSGGTPQQLALAIEAATASWQQFVREQGILPE